MVGIPIVEGTKNFSTERLIYPYQSFLFRTSLLTGMKLVLITILILLTLVVLPVANCLTKNDIKIGEKYPVVVDGLFGCVEKEQFQTILGYLTDGDKEAYKKALLGAILDGSAVIFEKGQTANVISNEIAWNSLIKIRIQGDTQEYWTSYITLTG